MPNRNGFNMGRFFGYASTVRANYERNGINYFLMEKLFWKMWNMGWRTAKMEIFYGQKINFISKSNTKNFLIYDKIIKINISRDKYFPRFYSTFTNPQFFLRPHKVCMFGPMSSLPLSYNLDSKLWPEIILNFLKLQNL